MVAPDNIVVDADRVPPDDVAEQTAPHDVVDPVLAAPDNRVALAHPDQTVAPDNVARPERRVRPDDVGSLDLSDRSERGVAPDEVVAPDDGHRPRLQIVEQQV